MNIVNSRVIPTVTQKDIDALLEVGGRAIHAEFMRGNTRRVVRDPNDPTGKDRITVDAWTTIQPKLRESFIREFGAAVNAITAAGWEIRRKR